MDSETIGAWCSGVVADSDGVTNVGGSEWRVVMLEMIALVDPAYELSGGWVVSVRQGSGKLSDEARSNLAAV